MPRASDRIFDHTPRRLLRKRISRLETGFGALALLVLAAIGGWIGAQRERFDPGERDLSPELEQRSESGPIRLHPRALERLEGRDAPSTAASELGVFPAALLAEGWQVEGRVESWGRDDLYQKINGAAEQFLRHGFRSLDEVTLVRDQNRLSVELYDQGDAAGAFGIFGVERRPGREIEDAEGLHLSATPIGLIALIGSHFVKIHGDSASAELRDKARGVAHDLARALPRGAPGDEGLALLAGGLGTPLEQVRYQPDKVFHFEFLRDFWFAEVDSPTRIFVHAAADSAAAARLFERILAEQRQEYRVVEAAGGDALLQHRFLGTSFVLRREGPILYGVERGADAARARLHADRLQEVLRHAP